MSLVPGHLLLGGVPIVGRRVRGVLSLRSHSNPDVFVEAAGQTLPPCFIAPAQLGHQFWPFGSKIIGLPRVGFDVVQLLAVYQPVTLGHHRRLTPLFRVFDALRMHEQGSFRPRFGIAPEERRQAGSIQGRAFGLLNAG